MKPFLGRVLGLGIFLMVVGLGTLQAGGPTLEHQPPTGLTHNTKGATEKPDGQGGSIISKKDTQTSKDGTTTTTTTVTKTKQTSKDSSTSDATVTQTQSQTTAKDQHGNEYVKTKTNTTVKTTRTTDADGKTTATSSSSGNKFEYKGPNEDGVSEVKEGKVLPGEKLENKPDETETRSYTNDDGRPVTVRKHPEEGTTTTTDLGNGRSQSVNEKGDGTKTITLKEGKEKTTEHYDKDGKLTKTEKTDKKGNTTTEYPKSEDTDDSSFEDGFDEAASGNGSPLGRDMTIASGDRDVQRDD